MENKDLKTLLETRNNILINGSVDNNRVFSFNEWKQAKTEIDHQLLNEELLLEGELITEGFFGNLIGKFKNWLTGFAKKLDAKVGSPVLDDFVDQKDGGKLGAIFANADIKTKPIEEIHKEITNLVGPKTYAAELFDNLFKTFEVDDKAVANKVAGSAAATTAVAPTDQTELGKEASGAVDTALAQRGENIKKKFDQIAAETAKMWDQKMNIFRAETKSANTSGKNPASDLRYFSIENRLMNMKLAFNKLTQELLLKRWDYKDLGDLQNKMQQTVKAKQENTANLNAAMKEVEAAAKQPAATEQPAAEQPAAAKTATTTEQPAAEQPAAAKTATTTEQPAAAKTATTTEQPAPATSPVKAATKNQAKGKGTTKLNA